MRFDTIEEINAFWQGIGTIIFTLLLIWLILC